jgi:Mrp family chromosome partitioning ATPase
MHQQQETETSTDLCSPQPEDFAFNLLNLADRLEAPGPARDEKARGEDQPEGREPLPEADPQEGPSAEILAESEAYEPPALDPVACLRTFAVLNPQCRREYLEQFRALRTRLCLEQRNWSLRQQDLRVVSVLSPAAGDGRSFIAANLAAALAVSDAQVLLVDVNTAGPKLHESLGIPPEPGLTEALQGPRGLANKAWWTVLHRVPGCNLFTMTLGAGGASQIDTVDLQKLPSLIEHWRQCFDWVILDGPAFEKTSDAEILSHIADASLLVLRPGHTPFALAQQATAHMPADRILGVVMNPRRG